MAIRVLRPSVAALRTLAASSAHDDLTYEPADLCSSGVVPPGYRRDRWSAVIGRGDDVFERAAVALVGWKVQEGAGLLVAAPGPATVGTVVAMAAPLPLGWVDVVCRVVDVIDLPDRRGFTYGTLSVHPEQGEESFTVVRGDDGTVTFEIVAVSRPRHVLARACPPVSRRLQRSATNRYLAALRAAAAG